MALTPFGKAVRMARLDADVTLSEMAAALCVTSAFLSSIETGRKKTPDELVLRIEEFFAGIGKPLANLRQLADVSNKSVSLEGLSDEHQMMVAGFARVPWNSAEPDEIENMKRLLKSLGGGKNEWKRS